MTWVVRLPIVTFGARKDTNASSPGYNIGSHFAKMMW